MLPTPPPSAARRSSQRDFLAAMGLEPRVNALLCLTDDRQARRELAERRPPRRLPGMGTAYKVFGVASDEVGRVTMAAGARPAPPLRSKRRRSTRSFAV